MAKADKKQKEAAKQANPSKSDKFVEIALKRMPKVLKGIALLGNLANNSYESTPEQRAKIIEALKEAVNEVASRYAGTKETTKGFNF